MDGKRKGQLGPDRYKDMQVSIGVSIVILTYNRLALLEGLLLSLSGIAASGVEIVVVDNASVEDVPETVRRKFPHVKVLRMQDNIGIAGRNRGISSASGDVVVTIDDDVTGIDKDSIRHIRDIFANNPRVGAVCFRVVDAESGHIINWCHHYRSEEYSDKVFITDEISEGAVAFRRSALELSGLYPERFFISHEGADLAYRLMNHGYDVIYNPVVTVKHYHSPVGRTSWRRYYYDTRNLMWLTVRNYPVMYGLKVLLIGVGSQFIYSLRDGYLKYWVRGVVDGIKGIREALRERCVISDRTMAIMNEIDRVRPGFLETARRRLFQKGIRI